MIAAFEAAHRKQFGFIYRRQAARRRDRSRSRRVGGGAGIDEPDVPLAERTTRSRPRRDALLLRRRLARAPASSCRDALAPGPDDRRPGARSSSRTRRSSSSPAGRPRSPRRTTSCCAAPRRAEAARAHRHRCRPGDAGGVQQPLHVDRRADGRDAAEHRLFGEHQGAARLLLRASSTATGALVANAPHMPVHLGSMDRSVETIIRLNPGDIHPGDVFALNAPYNGGTHLPDITVVTPVFDDAGQDDPLLGRLARPSRRCRRHGAGLDDAARHHRRRGRRADRQFPPRRARPLPRGGAASTLLTDHPYPCRNPAQNIADLKAQIAANEKGVARAPQDGRAFRARRGRRPIWATSRTTPPRACAACIERAARFRVRVRDRPGRGRSG